MYFTFCNETTGSVNIDFEEVGNHFKSFSIIILMVLFIIRQEDHTKTRGKSIYWKMVTGLKQKDQLKLLPVVFITHNDFKFVAYQKL